MRFKLFINIFNNFVLLNLITIYYLDEPAAKDLETWRATDNILEIILLDWNICFSKFVTDQHFKRTT